MATKIAMLQVFSVRIGANIICTDVRSTMFRSTFSVWFWNASSDVVAFLSLSVSLEVFYVERLLRRLKEAFFP